MLADLLKQKKTLIVVGPGGVGKTTTSAAFAVRAARMGLKVLVLTVDPARRLANSLGVGELGNSEVEIAPERFVEAGVPLDGGRLFAMMLDTKRTFDGLIERYAPSPEVRQRIFDNPFYQQASTALAGSQEYMAMEKLYEIREDRDYDLIVLDTPPTANALDFLTAPNRLEDFLSSEGTRVLLRGVKAAGRVGLGFLRVNSFVMRRLNRFVGAETFLGILEFIESFQEMYRGFKERAARVREIFRSPDVAFVIVTSTDSASIDEATFFYEQLQASDMPFGGIVVNRVRPELIPPADLAALEGHLLQAAAATPSLAATDPTVIRRAIHEAASACASYAILSDVDKDRLRLISERFAGEAGRTYPVPLFDRDIHDIESLARFADHVAEQHSQG